MHAVPASRHLLYNRHRVAEDVKATYAQAGDLTPAQSQHGT